jgi:hypothetical protein
VELVQEEPGRKAASLFARGTASEKPGRVSVRLNILICAGVVGAAGLLIPVPATRAASFWWGPRKNSCFPYTSPTFGYTAGSWRPWPALGESTSPWPMPPVPPSSNEVPEPHSPQTQGPGKPQAPLTRPQGDAPPANQSALPAFLPPAETDAERARAVK